MAVWKIIAAAAAVLSLVSFVLYGSDKRRARRGDRRIPEATLLSIGIFFGAAGAVLGMNVFRHKTRHWYFWAVNVTALLGQAFLLAWLYLRGI